MHQKYSIPLYCKRHKVTNNELISPTPTQNFHNIGKKMGNKKILINVKKIIIIDYKRYSRPLACAPCA